MAGFFIEVNLILLLFECRKKKIIVGGFYGYIGK